MTRVAFVKWYAGIYSLLAWVTLVLQFILMIDNRSVSVPMAILRFFSYFTIESNILAALGFTGIFLHIRSGRFNFFSSPPAHTAITIYMLVVGITYNTILRSLWQPQGLQYLVDESLHLILPLLSLVGWLLFVPKVGLRWSMLLKWLAFPLFYVLLVMVEGACTGWYPYPFADAAALGYPRALLNGLLILIGFGVLGIIFIGMARLLFKHTP